jgi:hydroxymethylpyrimidine pyrophosphatase-like HAD family hydrolase
MTIAVDFDGTIVTHEYPQIGKERTFATDTLKHLIQDGHKLVLWTVREGDLLDEAVNWCKERGVEFYAINRDYPEEERENNNHFSRKLKVDLWIDDRNIGGIPDWGTIYRMIKENLTWEDIIHENSNGGYYPQENQKKKKWWMIG